MATYGTPPIVAILFQLLKLLSGAFAAVSPLFPSNSIDFTLYANALSFFFAVWTIHGLIIVMVVVFSAAVAAIGLTCTFAGVLGGGEAA